MVDNTGNFHHAAPDKYDPIIELPGPLPENVLNASNSNLQALHGRATGYWLANMQHGQVCIQQIRAPFINS